MDLLDLIDRRILLLDGAMGTALQQRSLPAEAYGGHEGCPEFLVVSTPETIESVHADYLAAGAEIVETDTFGASPVVLAEFDLAGMTEELNATAARLARRAADRFATPEKPRFVAGSIGPGTKLATLGQIGWQELFDGYRRQIAGLLAGGVDLLLIETVQDLLQAKAAVAAAREEMARGRTVPLWVSVTVEPSGTLLTGSDIGAVTAVLEPLGVDILGLNCATGPAAMRPHLEAAARSWPGRLGLYPNAGLPQPCATGVCYPEGPAEFASLVGRLLDELPINVVGGCCGTTPEHIEALAGVVAGRSPLHRRAVAEPRLASLYGAVDIRQRPRPLYIGERANATGSKAFREALLAADHERATGILVAQEQNGSHAADLSTAHPELDEGEAMETMVGLAARGSRLPLSIDSSEAAVTERALRRCPGRPIVNSINLEDGGRRAEAVCPLARRHGAALVCLTIDERGMAMTADRKLEIARRLVGLCVDRYGFRSHDLLIDPLTFTIGSGDPSLRTSARETLEALRLIKAELPGVHTLLGLSNVSFGLFPAARTVMNSVFLDLALEAGLDAAILNPAAIVPAHAIEPADRELALDLLLARAAEGRDPLEAFIERFVGRAPVVRIADAESLPPERALFEAVVRGDVRTAQQAVQALLAGRPAEAILNEVLMPAMQQVGDLFGAGRLQLPFVLKSAEAMKRSVDELRPHFAPGGGGGSRGRLLIATVRGDVHDIGKNLVSMIVANNGFEVTDLGTRVPVETIIAEARRTGPDAIGMSGLLVSSAMAMADNLRAMRDAGLSLPVLVGGAALTPRFADEVLRPAYPAGPVAYCRDAFEGLQAMQAIAAGERPGIAPAAARTPVAAHPGGEPDRPRTLAMTEPPVPPFRGARIARDLALDPLFELVNEVALFRGRWGYRRGSLSKAEYDRLIETEVRPRYLELRRIVKAERLFAPAVAYGWFDCRSEGDELLIDGPDGERRLRFPRQAAPPRRCIADFFRPDGDVVGLFVATIGNGPAERGTDLFRTGGYLEYFLLHGLAVETTDALAEYCHWTMRNELGIGEPRRLDCQELVTQKYRGGRFGFGYPACPDLAANRTLFELLGAERLGLALTEGYQMVPEFSTSALVAHHPGAKYFAV